jgi:hypothetical protein
MQIYKMICISMTFAKSVTLERVKILGTLFATINGSNIGILMFRIDIL